MISTSASGNCKKSNNAVVCYRFKRKRAKRANAPREKELQNGQRHCFSKGARLKNREPKAYGSGISLPPSKHSKRPYRYLTEQGGSEGCSGQA